jgi:hypothetical protein
LCENEKAFQEKRFKKDVSSRRFKKGVSRKPFREKRFGNALSKWFSSDGFLETLLAETPYLKRFS